MAHTDNLITQLSTFAPWRERFLKLQFNRKQQKIFLEDLAILINDGVAPSQAIDILCETTVGVRHTVAQHMSNALSQGQQLAVGMQGWFCRIAIEIMHAGETSGTLKEAVNAALLSLQDQQNIKQEFINSLLYPLIVFTLACVLTVFIKSTVLDAFLKIKPVTQWPDIGVNLFYFAKLIQDWWWLFLTLIALSGFFIWRLLRDLTGDVRFNLDKLPIISIYRDAVSAKFMQILGRMLDNGLLLKKALLILQQDAEPYLTWHLMLMEFNLSGGNESIADVIDTKLIQHDDLLRLKVVARTRGFAKALMSLGQQTSARVKTKILLLGKILGAVFLISSGIIAATTIFAIYSIGSTIAT